VEDSQANALLVEQLISRRDNLRLLRAVNGDQGIEMANSHKPDLILMDMKLPGISGIDALIMLRNDPATALIPIIALSSNAFPSEIKKCLDAGCFRYLTKPFILEDLMDAIDAALQYATQNSPPR